MRYLNGGSLGPGIAFGEKESKASRAVAWGGGGGGGGGGVDGGARRQVSDAADPPSSN